MKITKQQLRKLIKEQIERVDVGPESSAVEAFMLVNRVLKQIPDDRTDWKEDLKKASDILNWIIKTDSGRKSPR